MINNHSQSMTGHGHEPQSTMDPSTSSSFSETNVVELIILDE